ncbi:hypothetical protein CAPTEDRAFT_222115 [Capitella teleta]|uniref:EF-hand domain-containing protein n=1 Tax=Capitella teleta TaxID=283909 RepID=R7V5T1_CAPTE|nr:hypothetical protein CAPTEDRAFT_222115 [Capitella teleta]|eukprot:ELU13837.1 hypothetical protein CAPTEDRAFT_222115 [Capitella teleta]
MANVKLNNEKLAELKEAFMLFDYNKSGVISNQDIGSLIRSVGLKPSQSEVSEIVNQAGGTGQEIDLQTLVALISRIVTNPPSERPDDLINMFRMYDTDGRGAISVKEMQHLLTTVGEKLTDHEAEELMRVSGCVQGGGMVNYEKFVKVILQG